MNSIIAALTAYYSLPKYSVYEKKFLYVLLLSPLAINKIIFIKITDLAISDAS